MPGIIVCTFHLGRVLHCKFKISSFSENKVHLIACRYHQRPRINYGESFSPIMHLNSLYTFLALAASRRLNIVQFNVMSSYLHRNLKELMGMSCQVRKAGSGASRRFIWVSPGGLDM